MAAEISAGTTMGEVLRSFPGAQRALMRRYHIGGCSSCGFSPEERLGDVLSRHNVLNAHEVIAHIKESHEQEQRMQVGPSELAEELQSERPPKLIDVRTPQEQEICTLHGALPASQELVQEMLSSWSKETPIVVICHRGMRSLDAASYLIGHGFTQVRSLRGGVDAWAQEVDPAMARY